MKKNVKLIDKVRIKLKKFMTTDIKMKMLISYLTINLMYLLIGSYLFFTEKTIEGFQYKKFSIGLKYLFMANTIIFLVMLIRKWRKKDLKNFKKPIYIGIALAIIFGIISMIFAFDRNVALDGCLLRFEGLYSILYYLTLMLLVTFVSKKYKKFLVNTILLCGAIQAIYGICQCFSLFNVKQVFHAVPYWDNQVSAYVYGREIWVVGFISNPNFFGTYMLLCLSYSIGLLIDSKKMTLNIIYTILSALFMFALLLSNATSCAVGLIIVMMYVFVYCLKHKYYEKFLVVFVIILSITCLTVKLGKTNLIKDVLKVGNEATQIAKGNFDDTYGTKRMYIWKNTLKIVPKYLLHGVGIDNFYKAFDGKGLIYRTYNKNILYDKAHNEYLQILVTQGIFALVSYLFIYGYAVYKGTKYAFKDKQIYLVLPVIGYLVQAFFNISVIEVAPIFYMSLGLCCNQEEKIKAK